MKAILLALLFIHPTIEWDSAKRITWTDFKGLCKDSSAAATCTNIYMENEIDGEGNMSFNVRAVFLPTKSYVSPTCSKSIKLLQHERLHFDITEVYARRLRILLVPFQHSRPDKYYNEAMYWYEIILQQWREAQASYDLESEHSQNVLSQQAWEVHIKNELNKSEYYANKSSLQLR